MSAMRVCVPVRNIPFEDQTNSFFLSLGQGVYDFEESPKTTQDVIGDVFCPGKYCFIREKCDSLDGFVTPCDLTMVMESVEPCYLFTKILYVTRTRQDNQNKKNTIFCCR